MHLLLVLAAASSAPAATVVYPAAFYVRFSPNSALDMAAQTPGFSLQEGAVRRGFSGSGGNVLIDGARPSAKTASLESLLAQIPAGQVERIEVIRGADQAGKATGHSVLLNVVRRRAAGRGAWTSNVRLSNGGVAILDGSATWAGPVAPGDLRLSLSRNDEYRATAGLRLNGPAGGPLIASLEDTPRQTTVTAINAELKRRLAGGEARFNGRIQRTEFDNNQVTTPPPASGRNPSTLDVADVTDVYEAGGDWEREFGGYTLKLLGLGALRRFTDDVDARTLSPAGDLVFRQIQARTTDTTEMIGRAAVSHSLPAGHELRFGLEAAFNGFDAGLALEVDDGAGPRPVILPAANVQLRETRGEGFVADTWSWRGWRLEAVLAAELSKLTQSGDTNLQTGLLYVKPSVEAARPIGRGGQLRVKLNRDVGQLNFEDFVSFASIADDRVVGGNPNLKPQTQWRLEAGYDQRFWSKGALNLTTYHAWVSDVADVVPLLGRYDAPGNIGSGRFWGGSANLTLPLDRWIAGAVFSAQGRIDDSRVIDPTTGLVRRASGLAPLTLFTQFRQDLPGWKAAWGVSTIKFGGYALYRRTEIDRFEQSTQLDAFVEKTVRPALKVRLHVANLVVAESVRTRTFFAPDRSGAPNIMEIRERNRGRVLGLEIRGAF